MSSCVHNIWIIANKIWCTLIISCRWLNDKVLEFWALLKSDWQAPFLQELAVMKYLRSMVSRDSGTEK
jgi:hypothetical protein